jgi:hypothetical protein
VADLIQQGRVDLSSAEDSSAEDNGPQLALLKEDEVRSGRQTHEVVDTPDGLLLKRLHFDCGFHCHH